MFLMRRLTPSSISESIADTSGLREWVLAGPRDEGRIEAERLILECSKSRHGPGELKLTGLNLSSLPECVGDLNLKTLWLSKNRLREIPRCIQRLKNLTHLTLDENDLQKIPGWIKDLQHLARLSLNDNQISEISRDVFSLPGLEELHLKRNALQTLNPDLYRLNSLKTLDVSSNQIRILPNTLVWMRSLDNLNLSHNKLTSLPRGWGKFEKDVPSIQLHDNHLLPPLPRQIERDLFTAHNLQSWFKKLDTTADFRLSTNRKNLIRRLEGLFDYLDQHPQLLPRCYQIAEEALGSCEDCIAWGLNQMDILVAKDRIKRSKFEEPDLFEAGRAIYRLDKLDQEATDLCVRLRKMGQFNVDLKRVQLAFQVGLKTDLDLPLSVHSMRHISASCVNQMDLDAAKKRILDGELIGLHRAENTYNESILALKSAKSGPIKPLPNLQDFKVQSLAYTLSRYRPWRKHVERAHPSEGQALQDLAHHYLQTALKAPLSENALRNGTESAEFLFSHGLAFAKALEAIRKIQERPGRLR